MDIKRFLKRLITISRHPVVCAKLYFNGSRNFVIGKAKKISGIKYLSIGNKTQILNGCRIVSHDNYYGEKYSPRIKICNNVYIAYNCSILAAAPIIIEDNTLIASNVLITSENHGMDPEYGESYGITPLISKKVIIGEGCWIGEKAIILPGVELGKRCIVAAGAVVTKSFPAYSLVGGCPAKVLKKYNFDNHLWESVDEKEI